MARQNVTGLQKKPDLRHFLSPVADLRRRWSQKCRPATQNPIICDANAHHMRQCYLMMRFMMSAMAPSPVTLQAVPKESIAM